MEEALHDGGGTRTARRRSRTEGLQDALKHGLQFIPIRQLQVEPDDNLFDIEREGDGMAGKQAGGTRAIVNCRDFPELAGDCCIL